MDAVQALLTKNQFPRSNTSDHAWMLDNQMGPNALWLAEWLCTGLSLAPEMRVLDLYDPSLGVRAGVDK